VLRIRNEKHLAGRLGVPLDRIRDVLARRDEYCEELLLIDPSKADKPRPVINIRGELRRYQQRFYRDVLLPKLAPLPCSHGGIEGRSIKTNVSAHLGSTFAMALDIANFYPSIRYHRVYELFATKLECSPDVARLCTQLCTYQHHLALGLVTSPILADQLMRRIDIRLMNACARAGLIYTRFVDDLIISGGYDLERSGFPRFVVKILAQDGFATHPLKTRVGRLDGTKMLLTGLRVVRGHLDVRQAYARELDRQLADAASLGNDGPFEGPYYLKSQIAGRMRFISWINPDRQAQLMRRSHAIDWKQVESHARTRCLIASKKTLAKVS
jgi:RNA-directed DNA polymerase